MHLFTLHSSGETKVVVIVYFYVTEVEYRSLKQLLILRPYNIKISYHEYDI